VYEFSRNAAANLREKEDHYNEAIGGFLAGSILGLGSMATHSNNWHCRKLTGVQAGGCPECWVMAPSQLSFWRRSITLAAS